MNQISISRECLQFNRFSERLLSLKLHCPLECMRSFCHLVASRRFEEELAYAELSPAGLCRLNRFPPGTFLRLAAQPIQPIHTRP